MNSAHYAARLSFRLVSAAILSASMLAAACSPGYRSDGDSRDLRGDLDDRTIESRVRVAIGSDEQTAGEKFRVESEDGVVYLRGTVSSSAAARRAVALSVGVDGVRRVVDRTRTVPD